LVVCSVIDLDVEKHELQLTKKGPQPVKVEEPAGFQGDINTFGVQ
jgi:hypothetical protein